MIQFATLCLNVALRWRCFKFQACSNKKETCFTIESTVYNGSYRKMTHLRTRIYILLSWEKTLCHPNQMIISSIQSRISIISEWIIHESSLNTYYFSTFSHFPFYLFFSVLHFSIFRMNNWKRNKWNVNNSLRLLSWCMVISCSANKTKIMFY